MRLRITQLLIRSVVSDVRFKNFDAAPPSG
jgi:hypothetical protein